MKLKQILALLIAVSMLACICAGCGDTSTPAPTDASAATGNDPTEATAPQLSSDPLTMIYEGYYSFSYPVDGMDDMCAFFHFYPEAPVLGSVFYASYAWNQIIFAGTYTVEEVEHEYTLYADRESSIAENPEKITGTAPYTITFFDFDGNVLDSCGYDGEHLYNDMTVVTGTGGNDYIYSHDTLGEASPCIKTYNGELGVSYLSFVAVEDKTCTVALQHNSTYTDLVGMMVEGSWTMAENDDGTYTFTLEPNESYDVGATLEVAADKMTATYTSADGATVMELVNASTTGPKLVYQLKGLFDMGGDLGSADVILNMYDDGNCTVAMTAFGSEMELDAGTYAIGADGYTINFAFDNAGELSSYLSEAGVSLNYIQAGSAFGDLDLVLDMVPVESEEPTLVYTLAGTHNMGDAGDATLTLSLMSDGTCTLVAAAYGAEMEIDAGTYAMGADGYTITCTFNGAGELVSFLSTAGVSLQYVNAESALGPIDATLDLVME